MLWLTYLHSIVGLGDAIGLVMWPCSSWNSSLMLKGSPTLTGESSGKTEKLSASPSESHKNQQHGTNIKACHSFSILIFILRETVGRKPKMNYVCFLSDL